MVVEVAVRGTEYATADLLTPEVTVAMAVDYLRGWPWLLRRLP